MGLVIKIAQLILSLSILVVLHELGHFLPARWFKTRVEKFYLFFDPYFSIFKKKIGETEYGIGWLPLGGYVKIAGMVDESMDMEQMKQPAQPWEFRSKPAWQRLIIMLGGVTVNFLLGILIYAMVFFTYGEEYIPTANAKFGVTADSLGMQLGIQDGDMITKVGEKPFDKLNDMAMKHDIIIDGVKDFTVIRAAKEVKIPITTEGFAALMKYENREKGLFLPRFPFVVAKVIAGSGAEKGGVMQGDTIVGINDVPAPFFSDFVQMIKTYKDQVVSINVKRGSEIVRLTVTTTAAGKIGAAPQFGAGIELAKQNYGFFESFAVGTPKAFGIIGDQIKAFGKMFKGEIKASESLGGFASIADTFGDKWIWERFWIMTGTLSMVLAFMNLLPIPALDGGHVVFLLYEVVSGRKPSDKFMERATTFGFVLLMSLLLYANGMDVIRRLF